MFSRQYIGKQDIKRHNIYSMYSDGGIDTLYSPFFTWTLETRHSNSRNAMWIFIHAHATRSNNFHYHLPTYTILCITFTNVYGADRACRCYSRGVLTLSIRNKVKNPINHDYMYFCVFVFINFPMFLYVGRVYEQYYSVFQ